MIHVNNAYTEYFEEDITLDNESEIKREDGSNIIRGRVVINNHPVFRRQNSQIRTAPFDGVGEIVEINKNWFDEKEE